MGTPLYWIIAPLACLITATAHAGEFPDEFFFSGAKRPAALRALEGKAATEIQVDAWIGDETSLNDHRGDVVIIDFWATWCGPCVASIPHNIELVNQYGNQGFTFIGIHDAKNGWNKADALIKSKGVNYPVAKDADGKSAAAYNLQFWPTYIAIDRTGTIRAAGLRPDKVENVVKALLAEAGGNQTNTNSKGEFPSTWFIGADKRTPSLRNIEGKKAPTIPIASLKSWIGTEPAADAMQGHVTVLRFISPDDRKTPRMLTDWDKQAKALSKQGVVFIGVCDPMTKWGQLKARNSDDSGMPIALDLPPSDGGLPMGRIAAAYGIRMWPTTIVIDRNGIVRAAGLHDTHINKVVTKLLAEPTHERTSTRDSGASGSETTAS
jgi:thiol-disulfide isomerase/thioredoxin